MATGLLLAATMGSGWLPEAAKTWGLSRRWNVTLRLLGALIPAALALLLAWNAGASEGPYDY